MMFVKMGGGAIGRHEKLKEVGKEGDQNIMKKKTPRDVVQSTYVLGIGGKIFKWVVVIQGQALIMYDDWRRMGRGGRGEVLELVA